MEDNEIVKIRIGNGTRQRNILLNLVKKGIEPPPLRILLEEELNTIDFETESFASEI